VLQKPKFQLAGDHGLMLTYGEAIDPDVNKKIHSMTFVLKNDPPEGVVEIIPAYCSLLLLYDPAVTTPVKLQETLISVEGHLPDLEIPSPNTFVIPVCYGGDYGPDIDYVAKKNRLAIDDVVRFHSEPEYLIHMIGFAPGFPFLGGLPEILYSPRLETPRTSVPEGSVGIANNQTGVYPLASPGGWRLVGRTPLRLFDPKRKNPIPYRSGDRIRFKSISPVEYRRLETEAKK